MILGASSDFFGGMADLAGAFAGEQSAAYKALFAISKGFAIAQAALSLQVAISRATELPWPTNLPAIGQAVSLGAQIASSIGGLSYGGAREFGGPVDAGKMYRMGEGGKPEILQSGGKNFANRSVGLQSVRPTQWMKRCLHTQKAYSVCWMPLWTKL
jgi:hypothetical protein